MPFGHFLLQVIENTGRKANRREMHIRGDIMNESGTGNKIVGDEQGDALPTENPNLLQVPKRRRTIRAS